MIDLSDESRFDFLSRLCNTKYRKQRSGLQLPQSVLDAVYRRDLHSCRFCSFSSYEYQEIAILGEYDHDIDHVVVVCPACHHCLEPTLAMIRKSAYVVFMPAVSQTLINGTIGELYSMKISEGLLANLAESVIELGMQSKAEVERVFGGDPLSLAPEILAKKIRELKEYTPEFINGLRLFPSDMYFVTDGALEFNMYPQMIAYYRSENGPLKRPSDTFRNVNSDIRKLLAAIAPDEFKKTDETFQFGNVWPGKSGVPHWQLGVKLLNDAASFFETIGEQNPALREQMTDNSFVFREVARLLEKEPKGRVQSTEEQGQSGQPSHQELAEKLLRDAADFFETIGDQNIPLEPQMVENASVFREVAELIGKDINGIIYDSG